MNFINSRLSGRGPTLGILMRTCNTFYGAANACSLAIMTLSCTGSFMPRDHTSLSDVTRLAIHCHCQVTVRGKLYTDLMLSTPYPPCPHRWHSVIYVTCDVLEEENTYIHPPPLTHLYPLPGGTIGPPVGGWAAGRFPYFYINSTYLTHANHAPCLMHAY